MLFNSYPFLFLFLPVTCAGFFAIGRWSRPAAAAFLALASLAFYAWWDVRFVPVLAGSVIWNFGAGLAIAHLRRQGRERASRWALATGVGVDLAVLGYFKYVNFFIVTANSALGTTLTPLAVILPLGISFFTFTQIAFLADTAFRGEVKEYNLDPLCAVRHLFSAPDRRSDPASQGDDAAVRGDRGPTCRALENFAVGIAYLLPSGCSRNA